MSPGRRYRPLVSRALAVVLACVLAACASNGSRLAVAGEGLLPTSTTAASTTTSSPAPASTTTSASAANTTTTRVARPATTSTTSTPMRLVAPEPGTIAVRTPSGILALWHGLEPDGRMRVSTPCDRRTVIASSPVVRGIDVLLDPGHGGLDGGARSANGQIEAEINLDVSRRVATALRAAGRTVEMTRDDDYFRTIADRGQLAMAIQPKIFVSIHHNSGVDAPSRAGIGSEIYHQRTSAESRRLGGLVYEQLVGELSLFDVAWTRTNRFGVRYRDNGNGEDFYGVLRRTAGVPSILIEAAYLSNDREAAVLATDAFRAAEARAITAGILRWLTSTEPGSGFEKGVVEGGTGGNTDLTRCRDPELNTPR